MPNVIEVFGLHKSFGKFPALNGVDLTVAQGQVHGFLVAGAVSRRRYFASTAELAFLQSACYVLIAGLLIAAAVDRADLGVSFEDVAVQAGERGASGGRKG